MRTEIEIPIVLTKASLGGAGEVFAKIVTTEGQVCAYLPRERITIDEQPLIGDELTAKLAVRVVEEQSTYVVVETEDSGISVKWRFNLESGKIEPVGYRPVYST